MKRIFFLVILLFSLLCVPISTGNDELAPENTVILSNETDASFCRDFSVLLRRLRPEWIILDSTVVPESVQDKNLIIIGGPDAEYTGVIIEDFLTQKEVDSISDGQYVILEKESPWGETNIIVCAGPDKILTKKAAEEAITSLEGEWVYPPFTSVPREEAIEYITHIQHIPDEELPKDALGVDVDAKLPSRISAEEAAEDIEYLFYLFSHGYCGYGYFKTRGDFDEAKNNILQELETAPTWSPEDFSQLIRDNLTFIHDCHLTVGYHKYGNHETFWYDTTLEFSKVAGDYSFVSDNTTYQVVSVNGEHPDEFMFPSLNVQGDPIYRIGILQQTAPEPVILTAQQNHEQHQFTIQLHCSDFTYFSKDIFSEDTIGGIPVVRIRSFSDHHIDGINQFLSAAQKYRGEPVLIVDIRGNGGGNEKWPKTWITRFTGQQPLNKRYFTEFISKTTMMGRANYFEYLLDLYPETSFYQVEKDKFTAQADFFEKYSMTPHWSGPFSEGAQMIPNDTTLIVVTNGKVGSAAEGFVNYVQQVENVIFVGENTLGALVFGQMTLHKLSHSNLSVNLPISLNIPLDLVLREEKGFFPDLWIPAEDAVNYAVAAVRKGTITTVKLLPEEVLQEEFIPEKQPVIEKGDLIPLSLGILFGIIFIFINRKKSKLFFFIAGICWAAAGIIILALVSPLGHGYSIAGMICIAISIYKWRKEKAVS